jgi:hypothetical protein
MSSLQSIYENHGKYWTVKETKQLMKEIKIMDINHIATMHKRTPNAIFLKIIKEASKIADDDYDITLNDLSIITTLPTSKLLEGFKKISFKRFNEVETSDDETSDDEEYDDNDDNNEENDDNDDNNDDNDDNNEENDDNNEENDDNNEENYYSVLMISTLITVSCWTLYLYIF